VKSAGVIVARGRLKTMACAGPTASPNPVGPASYTARTGLVQPDRSTANRTGLHRRPMNTGRAGPYRAFWVRYYREVTYARAVDILNTEALSEALGCLSDRARRMLELRYGLGGECPCTLAEVGCTFNVTRERIRQIESESLRMLKELPSAQQLRGAI